MISGSRHSRLPCLTRTGGVADPKQLTRAIRRSMARKKRKVTNPQMAEPTRHDLRKEDALNKLVNRVVSEECLASGGHVAEKEELVTIKATNVRDAIAGFPYHIDNALTAMITLGPDDGKLYGDSHMAATM